MFVRGLNEPCCTWSIISIPTRSANYNCVPLHLYDIFVLTALNYQNVFLFFVFNTELVAAHICHLDVILVSVLSKPQKSMTEHRCSPPPPQPHLHLRTQIQLIKTVWQQHRSVPASLLKWLSSSCHVNCAIMSVPSTADSVSNQSHCDSTGQSPGDNSECGAGRFAEKDCSLLSQSHCPRYMYLLTEERVSEK